MVEEQYTHGFSSYWWNQSPLDGLLYHLPYRPTSTPLGRITANHGDDALFLAIVEHLRCSGALLFIQRARQASLPVAMADFADRLRC
jgi:hypothetical protein